MRAINVGGILGKCVFCSHTLSETKDLRNKHAKIKAGKWVCGVCLLDLKEASFEVFFAYEEEEAEYRKKLIKKAKTYGWIVNPTTGKLEKIE